MKILALAVIVLLSACKQPDSTHRMGAGYLTADEVLVDSWDKTNHAVKTTASGSVAPVTQQLTPGVLSFAPLSIGDNVIVAASATKKTSLHRMLLVFAGAATVQLFDGASSGARSLTGLMTITAGGSIYLPFESEPHQVNGAINRAIIMTSTTAVNAGGVVGYVQN